MTPYGDHVPPYQLEGTFPQGGVPAPLVETAGLALQKRRHALHQAVTAAFLENVQVATWMDDMTDRMVMRLCADVLEHRVFESDATTVLVGETDVHTSPFQAWKARWLPRTQIGRWLLTRRPARQHHIRHERTIRLAEYATFPLNTMRYPDELGPVVPRQTVEVDDIPRDAPPERGPLAELRRSAQDSRSSVHELAALARTAVIEQTGLPGANL